MFCKWCGRKITNNGCPCPSCGKNQDPLENGNGFWDLCSKETDVQPVNTGTSVVEPAKVSGTEEFSQKDRNSRSSTEHKPAKKLWIGAWAATVVLLLIAIIVIIIGVGKISLCLSEISSLRSGVYNTNTLVTNGFTKLEEYHLSEGVPETQIPEETEPITDENTPIDFGNLIEENTLLVNDKALNIESYMIESTPTKYVYIADGEMLENENAKIFWQKSDAQGKNWETICEDASYIIVEANETDAYRIVCVVTDNSEAVTLYCAATIVLEENTDSQANDAETDTGWTTEDATEAEDAEDMQPNYEPDKSYVGDLDNGNNDGTVATDPEDGAVG